jgi:hypothetical protein
MLHIVSSPYLRPMSFVIGEEVHLVYDRQLGAVFDEISRLLVLAAPAEDFERYIYRLYGRLALSIGQLRAAAVFASAARSVPAAGDKRNRERPLLRKFREDLVAAQEAFILAHELVHVHLRGKSLAVRNWNYAEQVQELIARLRDAARRAKAGEELSLRSVLVQSVEEIFPPSPRHPRQVDDASALPTIEYTVARTVMRLFDLAMLRAIEDVELVEECVCDAFAAAMVYSYVSELGGSTECSCLGPALAIQNLTILQSLRDHLRRDMPCQYRPIDVFGGVNGTPRRQAHLRRRLILDFIGDLVQEDTSEMMEMTYAHTSHLERLASEENLSDVEAQYGALLDIAERFLGRRDKADDLRRALGL